MQKYRAAFFPQKLQGKLKNTSKSDLKLKIPDGLYNQTVLTSMAFQMPVGVLTACTTPSCRITSSTDAQGSINSQNEFLYYPLLIKDPKEKASFHILAYLPFVLLLLPLLSPVPIASAPTGNGNNVLPFT